MCVCVCVFVSVCGWFVVEPERRISIKRLTGFIWLQFDFRWSRLKFNCSVLFTLAAVCNKQIWLLFEIFDSSSNRSFNYQNIQNRSMRLCQRRNLQDFQFKVFLEWTWCEETTVLTSCQCLHVTEMYDHLKRLGSNQHDLSGHWFHT